MQNYKVLISSAGLGSRLKKFSKNLNKALSTIDRKPVISNIIDKIPEDVEIVITLGYKADTLKQFLDLAYPKRTITYVNVDLYQGEGSGLGYSILCAKDYLQCPFIFTPNDTLFTETSIQTPDFNYVCFHKNDDTKINSYEVDNYRTISERNGELIELHDKAVNEQTDNIYTGLCGINDFEKFWDIMESGKLSGSIELGESFGIMKMLEENIRFDAIQIDWWDTGNAESYINAVKKFAKEDHMNILSKDSEEIWFVGSRAIKYHEDPRFISDRVNRIKYLDKYVPPVIASTTNMYTYEKIEGKTFTYNLKYDKFNKFLEWIKEFWDLDNFKTIPDAKTICDTAAKSFYYDKTYERFTLYLQKFKVKDIPTNINGIEYPTMSELLSKLDWNDICDTVPSRFHGDLHFENIIVSEINGSFGMIDWRQGFGDSDMYGDIYYDLGKLLHGFIISHEMVDKNLFEINVSKNERDVDLSFYQKNVLKDFERIFEIFVEEELKLNFKKVRLMAGLIYVNVAALHHFPYCNLLYYLGKQMVGDYITNKEK